MPVLYEKSGAEGEYRRFKFEMIKLAEKNELPGYGLLIEQAKGGEPMLRMRRENGNDGAEAKLETSWRGEGPCLPGPQGAQARQDVSPGKHSPAKSGEAQQTRDEPRKAPSRSQRADEARQVTVDARALIRSTVAGLTDAATRGFMTDATIDHLRATCPGWDLYALHAEFERWVNASPDRTPADWQRAFIGWVKRHHDKHRNELRG